MQEGHFKDNVRFLIIRFSSIGDIVLTTPVIRCLKEQVENAEIHYLTKKANQQILENNPYIDKLHVLDDNLNEVVEEIRQEGIHYIVDLHRNIRSAMVKNKLKVFSFSFNKLNRQKWLLTTFKINRMPRVHIVDRYLETVKAFGIENDGNGLDYFLNEKDKVHLATLPGEFQNGYIGLVIGAKHATKKLPPDKLTALCNLLDKPVILLGGPEDQETGDNILAGATNKMVYNACGKYKLNQSASLVEQARVVISHDTGLMHVAAAFKKDIISVWGNTVPDFGMYPYVPGKKYETMEVKGLKCRPCSKIGFDKCPKKHFDCMNKIELPGIADKARQLFHS